MIGSSGMPGSFPMLEEAPSLLPAIPGQIKEMSGFTPGM
jgi:hypothetical protein